MSYAIGRKLRLAVAAVATGGLAVTGLALASPASASTLGHFPAATLYRHAYPTPRHPSPAVRVEYLNLSPMPQGTVTVSGGTVQVSAFGLTPGSAHTVEVAGPFGQVTTLGTLTANSVGQASATLTASGRVRGTLLVLDGGAGTDPIAQTSLRGFGFVHFLTAVEAGFPPGSLRGFARFVYNPATQTVTVTVNASGFSPGAHAAHIHMGSCQSQGPVLYPLQDLVANSRGQIINETRVVTGVTSVPATGWYLNLHQGTSANILDAAGNPTIFFRPLLCSNI